MVPISPDPLAVRATQGLDALWAVKGCYFLFGVSSSCCLRHRGIATSDLFSLGHKAGKQKPP